MIVIHLETIIGIVIASIFILGVLLYIVCKVVKTLIEHVFNKLMMGCKKQEEDEG